MHESIKRMATAFMKERSKRRRAYALFTALALVVSMTTTYLLVQPASAMEGESICGLEEHTHNEVCYEVQITCGYEESEGEEGHSHAEAGCVAEKQSVCICGKEECEAHTHEEACYSYICGKAETEGHSHSEACYSDAKVLSCTNDAEDHEHGDECYITEQKLSCGKSEAEAHSHEDSCIGLTCGKTITDGHAHSEACYEEQDVYTCGLEEKESVPAHTHTEECYEEVLVCGLEEHTHGDACSAVVVEEIIVDPDLICTLPEHSHAEDCLDETGSIICTLEEHTHTDECRSQEKPQGDLLIILPEGAEVPEGYDVEFTFIDPDNRYGVAVYAQEGTFPEGAELVAELMEEGSDAYTETTEVLEELVARGEADYDEFVALDVHFLLDGEEVQPACPVYVCINVVKLFSEKIDPTSISVHHFADAEVVTSTEEGLEEMEEPAVPMVEVGDVIVETVADSSEETGLVEGLNNEEETLETVTTSFDISGFSPLVFLANNDIQFTVQHYAYIPQLATSGKTALSVIDTSDAANTGSGPVLPKNGTTPVTKNLYLDESGVVATTENLTKMYADNVYMYGQKLSVGNTQAQNLEAINKLYENTNYELVAVWKLNSGKDPASINPSDWRPYDPATVTFVRSGTDTDTVLVLTEDTVLRMVYRNADNNNPTYSNDAAFYDYDVASKVSGNTMYTNKGGINSNGNNLAFGNSNADTGLAYERVEINGYKNNINIYNSTGSKYGSQQNGYKGCSFGLVNNLGTDGQINYTTGVNAPNMFNDGAANGKTTYTGTKMNFNRVGDVYELSSVSGSDNISVSNLNKFNNPTCGSTTYNTIFTNNFWPMDGVRNLDLPFGQYGNAVGRLGASGNTGEMPVSDDGKAHNSYFGLNFAVQFELTEDYVGPLDYVFFGDDDMWVFLSKIDENGNTGEGKLVCDIGGVHSSVGEYVNLWDYIQGGADGHADGTYVLSFFYTERGASGSTCYMRFTLPSVSSVPPDLSTGTLEISKEVVGATNYADPFEFTVALIGPNGQALTDLENNAVHSSQGVITVNSGSKVHLKHGESIRIMNLQVGTTFTVTEATVDGFHSSYQLRGVITESNTVSGNIPAGNVAIKFINTTGPVLPNTGGMGTQVYITVGVTLMIGASLVLMEQERRRRRSFVK